MFKWIKNWWNTPSKHPVALVIGGFGTAAACIYAMIKIIKNNVSI